MLRYPAALPRLLVGAAALLSLLAGPGCDRCRGGGEPGRGAAGPAQISEPVAEQMTATARALARTLEGRPDLLPPLLPEGTAPKVVMAVFDAGPGRRWAPHGPFPVNDASLAFDRMRASRRTAPPDFWVVLTDETGSEALYWVPVSRPDRVKVELAGGETGDPIQGRVAEGSARKAAVLLPFRRGALVVLYPTDPPAQTIHPQEVLAFGPKPPRWSDE